MLDCVYENDDVYTVEHITRVSLFSMCASFGGLMNFILRVSNFCLGSHQGFRLKVSMVKKLYSALDKKKIDKDELVRENSSYLGVNKKEEVINEIRNR